MVVHHIREELPDQPQLADIDLGRMLRKVLLFLALARSHATDRTLSAISNEVASDGKFLPSLEADTATCTLRKYSEVMRKLSEVDWPDGTKEVAFKQAIQIILDDIHGRAARRDRGVAAGGKRTARRRRPAGKAD